MTKIESRSVELDELPPWDDTDGPDHDPVPAGQAESTALPRYSLDSEQRTLVGIGPLKRGSRPREAAAPPDSQRMPHSEPPGPFIADDGGDEHDDELPVPRRGKRLGKRLLAVSGALLVPLAAVGLVRGLPLHEPAAGPLPRAGAARIVRSVTLPGEPELQTSPPAERARQETPESDAPPAVAAGEEGAPEPAKVRPRAAPSPERLANEAARPSVKLAELPPTIAIADRSNGDVNAGTINVASTPTSNVVLDGRPLGKSPRAVRVPAGLHTVVFIHPLYGRRSLSVNVRPGATTGASTEF